MNYGDFLEYMKAKLLIVNDVNKKYNILKEELQKNILYSMYSRGVEMYFLGGTNLRICYQLGRFSEDLVFALGKADLTFDIEKIMNGVLADFTENNYPVTLKIGNNGTVQKSFIKFQKILFDLGISPLRDENVLIKIEVDTNPAMGAENGTEIINTVWGTCVLKNQKINSTFSGKIGALLLREYTKGRDYYDIFWYFQNYSHIPFNLNYLQNVIVQYNQNNDQNVHVPKDYKEALNMILEKLEKTDFTLVKSDLMRFVSWDKQTFDAFFDAYNQNVFTFIQKYHSNLQSQHQNQFRL